MVRSHVGRGNLLNASLNATLNTVERPHVESNENFPGWVLIDSVKTQQAQEQGKCKTIRHT